MKPETILTDSYEVFKQVVKHPEAFLKARDEKSEQIKSRLLEKIYSYSRSVEGKKSKALDKLITNGMDDESIWQQIELKNEESFNLNLKNISRFLASSTEKFKLDLSHLNDGEDDSEAEDVEDEESEAGSEEDEDNEDLEVEQEEEGGSDDENAVDRENSEDEDDEEDSVRKQKKYRKSIVDDQFFKLREMEEFLLREDQREMNPGKENDFQVDMFESDDTNREESLKYADFFNDNEGEEYEEGEEEDEEPEEEEVEEGPKSTFELMQERLQTKIASMENRLLDDKPWQMKGEVKADNRPQNSLLEEVLEFDSTTRPAPIITEEVTMKLEDLIRQRIKDKAFDDVERKVKPSDIRIEYKKQLVLDQEKSKQSLAQIYEKEFIQEIEKNNPNDEEEPEEPKEHKEIRSELKDLFDKLDMLSNFHFTPRPAQPELKIITNLPTITMEEVAPVAVSDAAILAPEEIKRRYKGDIIGAGERSKTDKNRERRHKKVFQKDKFQKQSQGTKSITEKVMKSRNVEKMKTGDTTKSSSAFFSKLQDDISLKKNVNPKAKRHGDKPIHQAKKLKL